MSSWKSGFSLIIVDALDCGSLTSSSILLQHEIVQEDCRRDVDVNVFSMNDTNIKNGPIHFYPTNDRDAFITNVVKYCVQIGDRQPLTSSQAAYLIVSKEVSVDGRIAADLTEQIEHGARQISIRGRTHHVMMHQPIFE